MRDKTIMILGILAIILTLITLLFSVNDHINNLEKRIIILENKLDFLVDL